MIPRTGGFLFGTSVNDHEKGHYSSIPLTIVVQNKKLGALGEELPFKLFQAKHICIAIRDHRIIIVDADWILPPSFSDTVYGGRHHGDIYAVTSVLPSEWFVWVIIKSKNDHLILGKSHVQSSRR